MLRYGMDKFISYDDRNGKKFECIRTTHNDFFLIPLNEETPEFFTISNGLIEDKNAGISEKIVYSNKLYDSYNKELFAYVFKSKTYHFYIDIGFHVIRIYKNDINIFHGA